MKIFFVENRFSFAFCFDPIFLFSCFLDTHAHTQYFGGNAASFARRIQGRYSLKHFLSTEEGEEGEKYVFGGKTCFSRKLVFFLTILGVEEKEMEKAFFGSTLTFFLRLIV